MLVLLMERILKYVIQMGSGAMVCTPNFIKIDDTEKQNPLAA
jgi:hypothetical protein